MLLDDIPGVVGGVGVVVDGSVGGIAASAHTHTHTHTKNSKYRYHEHINEIILCQT